MKKIISACVIIMFAIILIFSISSYAAQLTTIDIQPSKTTVRPGEEVTLMISFGDSLASYEFNVSYDKRIFEYVRTEGASGNDLGNEIKVVYYDNEGGANPRTSASVTFKAKADLTTSNPTEFTVTATGLGKVEGGVTTNFDDITTAIVKTVTVEPEYIPYTLNLEYEGKITKWQEKEMKLSYSSSMGKYYEHVRLEAEATTPEGATVNLFATDEQGLEHDIIQSGWGDAQGYKIGGKDVMQPLNVRGLFSEDGDYTITLKLVNREDSDELISQKTFAIKVGDETVTQQPETKPNEEEKPAQEETTVEQAKAQTPKKLPKTGINIYMPIVAVLVILGICYVFYNKRK